MRILSIYYNDYSGGLNDTVHKRGIKRNEASLLRNWDITYKGQLNRRAGLTPVGRVLPFDLITVSENINITKT